MLVELAKVRLVAHQRVEVDHLDGHDGDLSTPPIQTGYTDELSDELNWGSNLLQQQCLELTCQEANSQII